MPVVIEGFRGTLIEIASTSSRLYLTPMHPTKTLVVARHIPTLATESLPVATIPFPPPSTPDFLTSQQPLPVFSRILIPTERWNPLVAHLLLANELPHYCNSHVYTCINYYNTVSVWSIRSSILPFIWVYLFLQRMQGWFRRWLPEVICFAIFCSIVPYIINIHHKVIPFRQQHVWISDVVMRFC